jgi:hypothetical protein
MTSLDNVVEIFWLLMEDSSHGWMKRMGLLPKRKRKRRWFLQPSLDLKRLTNMLNLVLTTR